MGKKHLSGLAVIRIYAEFSEKLSYDDFAARQCRCVPHATAEKCLFYILFFLKNMLSWQREQSFVISFFSSHLYLFILIKINKIKMTNK